MKTNRTDIYTLRMLGRGQSTQTSFPSLLNPFVNPTGQIMFPNFPMSTCRATSPCILLHTPFPRLEGMGKTRTVGGPCGEGVMGLRVRLPGQPPLPSFKQERVRFTRYRVIPVTRESRTPYKSKGLGPFRDVMVSSLFYFVKRYMKRTF